LSSENFLHFCNTTSTNHSPIPLKENGFGLGDWRRWRFCVKGRVHYFSMQVVINKFFLLNPEKKFGADPSCRFREKRKKRTL